MIATKKRLLFLLLFFGCKSPNSPSLLLPEVAKLEEGHFFINENRIEKLGSFSYRSNFKATLGQGDRIEEGSESIEVLGDGKRLLLKKTIDSSHFFELFSDGVSFIVKNQNQPWRKEDIHHQMYKKLFCDAMNLNHWLISQLAVDKKLDFKKGDKVLKKISFKNSISSDAPLLKRLASSRGPFKSVQSSLVAIEMSMDERLRIPVSADFFIDILGQGESYLKIRASMAIDQRHHQKLSMPEIKKQEVESAPVNLSHRFAELMGEFNK